MNIFFAVDDKFVPYLSVMLASVLAHAKDGKRYDLHILGTGIRPEYQKMLQQQVKEDRRFSLEFVDVTAQLAGRQFYTESRKDLNQSTYYRLLIPYLYPEMDRAVYLDGDMVALTDIARLDRVKLGDHLLAAVRDYQGIANVYREETDERQYIEGEIGILEPDELIIAGLLVLNLEQFRKHWTMEELLNFAGSREWRHHDQDILNVLSEGNKVLLDARWNILPDVGLYCRLPEHLYREWKKGAAAPYVVHFGGDRKPWKYPNIPYADLFWKYAEDSPFRKDILDRRRREFLHSGTFRKIWLEQLIVPLGSRRRAFAGAIWKSIRSLKSGATNLQPGEKRRGMWQK